MIMKQSPRLTLAAIGMAVGAALVAVPSQANAATNAPRVASIHVTATMSHSSPKPRECCYFEWEDFGTYSTLSQCNQAKAIWQPVLGRRMRCIKLGIGYVLQQLVVICMSKPATTSEHARGRAAAA